MKAPNRSRSRPPVHARFTAYLISHARAFLFSLGKLYRNPLASLMTMAVIGIALALPTSLVLILQNLQAVSGGWGAGAQISLYLHDQVEPAEAEALSRRLRAREEVAEIELIGREAALAEFRELSGFGEALAALEQNPLPSVIVIQPAAGARDPLYLKQLVVELGELAEVEIARLDTQWVERLHAMMRLAERGVLVVGAMLGIAVLLVVGNTIRLDIENRRQEIEVTKLIGATDAFIRRPFLYGGLWYGLLGALLGILMVEIAIGFLDRPARQLAGLYNSGFRLLDLDAGSALTVLGLGVLLGLAGSWFAVGRHLSDIEPR
ncbi:MAG: permease-like cell division protein FtsX [Chromatiales bacterium]|jgi:cell division transport system permease protein